MFASSATALAGFLDAVGYAQLNHLYVSFMSGNSAHLGMAAASGQWGNVIYAGFVIAAFVGGTFIGTLVTDASGKPVIAVLALELVLCAAATSLAAFGLATLALTLIALTMGMQNVMHQGVSGTDAGKSFITGALFGLGQAIARALRGRVGTVPIFVYGSSWLSFVAGVICGALSIGGWGLVPSLALACMGFILLAILAWESGFGE
nr:YoaK family protein [Rhizobium cauense]